MAGTEQSERETHRVIVLGQGGTDVLLVPNCERFLLPSVEIPCWQRVAENLTAAVEIHWGEEIVCLFEPTGPAASDGTVTRYQVAEHLRTRSTSTMPTRWVPLSRLSQDSFIDARDYSVICQARVACNVQIEGASAGPFARVGWFRELCDWIEDVVEPMGFHLNGEFRQLNASPSFSLVRFETDGPALWFKAVGGANQREFTITYALAQLFPDYLPQMLATRPDWNGWLTREVAGKLLSEIQEHALWEQAAVSLAKLQIESIGQVTRFLAEGARDLGAAVLSKLIRPFMEVISQLMKRQIKVPPAVLGPKDLLLLAGFLKESVDAMEAVEIPETLGHLDLNPGNIIVSHSGCVLLDWAEAFVGNPFLSLQYLLEHARRTLGTGSAIETKLIALYCGQWEGIVSPAAIADALALAPLLAVFAYAAGSDAWSEPERLQERVTAGYLRSLTRRMHREANELANRRTLCLR